MLKRWFLIAAGALGVLLMLGAGLGAVAVNKVRIGGEAYRQIIADKDFAADILPPPAYILEAYLYANQIMLDPERGLGRLASLDRLKSEYDARLTVWRAADLTPKQRAALIDQADPAAQEFWRVFQTEFAPAVRSGDAAMRQTAFAKMSADYERHRMGIDAAVVAAVEASRDHEQAIAVMDRFIFIGLTGGGALIALSLAFAGVLMARSVFDPLTRLSEITRRLADGDLDVDLQPPRRDHEIGRLASALIIFRASALENRRLEAAAEDEHARAEQRRLARDAEKAAEAAADRLVMEALGKGLSELSDGDLTYRITVDFPLKAEQLKTDFNDALGKLHDAIGDVVGNIAAIDSSSGEVTHAADDLSRRTEQQAASLEETAAALDEITATVAKTASGAREASRTLEGARTDAERTGAVVSSAVSAMADIQGSSSQISQIIGVIDEIAFQTNLLALNAGVEAARAGDAGRGFAVVAQEVRSLAQRSADSARQIKALILTSTRQVDQGAKLVGEAGEALERIVSHVARFDGLVGEIAASAEEQAVGLREVNTAVNQMDQVTQQNAAMVEQTTAASHALASEARALKASTGRFRLSGAPAAKQTPAAPQRRPDPAPGRAAPPRSAVALKATQQARPDDWEAF